MRHFLLFLLGATILSAAVLWLRYGGGEPYPDLTSAPLLPDNALEEVLSYPEPIGNVAVNAEGRLFFTVHPESRPQGNKLLEWVDGAAVPYPNGTVQPHLFDTVLGIAIDRQNRLWTIDNGNHGFGTARLLGLNLEDGSIAHNHEFHKSIAPAGSFLQDLQISNDGLSIFIADASVWRKNPGIIVYDVTTRTARRVLDSHPSVSAQNYIIRNPIRDMVFAGGIVNLKTGVDGIALDTDNRWLYYAAINNSDMYRVPVASLLDPTLPQRDLEDEVERYSNKPLNDGLSVDLEGNVYITDIEHGAVFIVDAERDLNTLLRSPRIRWADGLSFGPDGWLYLSDSAIPELVLKSKEYIRTRGPYHIFRFQPGHAGVPGQ